MRQIALVLFTAFSFTLSSQHRFGIVASGGVSKISGSSIFQQPYPKLAFSPSGNTGIYYSLDFEEKSTFTVELLFSQIEGKEKTEIDKYDINGNKIAHNESVTRSHISYLTLPFSFGMRMGKLTANVGYRISYALASSASKKGSETFQGNTRDYAVHSDDLGVKKFNYGPNIGMLYSLTNRLIIDVNYHWGIGSIRASKEQYLNIGQYIQQGSIGLKYTFI